MKNKKDLLGGVIIIVLLLLVLVTYMSFYNYNKQQEKIEEENKLKDNSLMMIYIYDDYTVSKVENKDNIDSTKTILGSYNCKSNDCDILNSNEYQNPYDNKYVILKENEELFIYDFTLNKIVSNKYDDIIYKLNDYYIVKDNNKYGIISKSGVELVVTSYDEILYNDIYDSYIKVKNNNLYGVIDLDNGNTIIDTKYNDIKINDSKYYSILKDNLWYVIDKEENVITNGYKDIFAFNKGFIALIDNNLQILKYNKDVNEPLNENIITIYKEDGYKISRNGSTISIEINNEDSVVKYEYNINRNNLISK